MPEPIAPPLADLGFQLIEPAPWLRPYVSAYWHFRRASPLATLREEFMHPRGGFGIVFNFGARLQLDGRPLDAPVFLDGANTISRTVGFLGQIELMGVRFHEGGAYPFLGIPLIELRNQIALLDALDRAELLELYERLAEDCAPALRVARLDAWLTGRLGRGKGRSALIPATLAMLRQHGGQLSIPALADARGVGQRQLERLFQAQVGMPPRQYGQLIRVEAARLALKRAAPGETGRVAADLGFYDQAHFIREFRAVVGLTPQAYLRRSRQRGSAGG